MSATIAGFRLSPQQQRLWRFGAADPGYRAQCAIALAGPVDVPRLRGAVAAAVDRHQILRTVYLRPPGVRFPLQVVREGGEVDWTEADLGTGDPAARERRRQELREREAERPFELADDAALRATLIELAADRHELLLTLPALAADAASLGRLADEIAAGYGGTGPGDEVVQYAQFGEWRHELLEDREAEPARQRWRRLEIAVAPTPRLPWELRAAGEPTFGPRTVERELDRERTERVAALAAAHGASTAAFLLASWQALLARLTGEPELSIGCVLDGRRYPDLASAVGLLAATVPVPGRVAAGDRFTDVLARCDEALASAYEAEEYLPADELLPPDPGAAALGYQFELHRPPVAVVAGGLRFEVVRQGACLERFKLKLSCLAGEGGVGLALSYDPVLLAPADAARIADHLERLIEAALARPEAAVGDLEILSDEERRALLTDGNQTERAFPRDRCLHELFEAQAARTPDDIAVVAGGERLTYAALDRRADALARRLRALGVGPESRVGVHLERGLAMAVAVLGVLKAGGAYLPLDPAYPAERLGLILADAEPAVVLSQKSLQEELRAAGDPPTLLVDGGEVATEAAAPLASGAHPDALAYVLYTSGSTGMPKGVMVPHRGVVNYLSWAVASYGLARGGRSPVHSPLGFDLTVTALFGPLLAGGTVELLPDERGVEALADALRASGDYALVKLTPAHLDLLEHQLAESGVAARVATLVVGGEALSADTLEAWSVRSPATRVYNEYGPTETVVGSCVFAVPAGRRASLDVPIGRPIANTRAYVLDAGLRPVPWGVAGELFVVGAGVTRGYLGRPDLTAERFLPDPWSGVPGERLYRTGDVVRRLPDGELEFLGRGDRQVKIRGYRVELGEVEAALERQPGVRDAVAIVREDAPGERRLVGYLVGDGGPRPAAEEIRAGLLRRLPEAMLPHAYVWLDALPLSPNGKLDRRRLPAPEAQRPELGREYQAPRDPIEEVLAGVFAEVLHLDRVGVHDSFFSLGGDSIRSVRLVAAAKSRGLFFTVQQLFRHRTVAELARHLTATGVPGLEAGAAAPELALLVAEVEGLSAEDVRREIGERLQAPVEEAG